MLPDEDSVIKPEDVGKVDILIGQFPELTQYKPLTLKEKLSFVDSILQRKKQEIEIATQSEAVTDGKESSH